MWCHCFDHPKRFYAPNSKNVVATKRLKQQDKTFSAVLACCLSLLVATKFFEIGVYSEFLTKLRHFFFFKCAFAVFPFEWKMATSLTLASLLHPCIVKITRHHVPDPMLQSMATWMQRGPLKPTTTCAVVTGWRKLDRRCQTITTQGCHQEYNQWVTSYS